jgi:hypothetical protein
MTDPQSGTPKYRDENATGVFDSNKRKRRYRVEPDIAF